MIAAVQLKPLEREVKFGISEATTEGSTITETDTDSF